MMETTTTTASLVITAAVNDRIAKDNKFAMHVWRSLLRFNVGDWGDTHADDWAANDADAASIKAGHGGRVLAVYGADGSGSRIWIIRDALAITVLFPEDY